jgi:heme-degrading monooxygenase HmoA
MTADPRREPPSPSESRYVSVSRLRVPAERAPELLAAFARRARLVDGFDGFLGLEVWQSERDPGEILMVSRWRDRDAFKGYMRSDAHRRSHNRIEPALQAVIKLERLEHFRGYDIVAR